LALYTEYEHNKIEIKEFLIRVSQVRSLPGAPISHYVDVYFIGLCGHPFLLPNALSYPDAATKYSQSTAIFSNLFLSFFIRVEVILFRLLPGLPWRMFFCPPVYRCKIRPS
jgi:hypothetical protein